jgi:hypothetical protein
LGQDADAFAQLIDGDLVRLFDSANAMNAFFSDVCESAEVQGALKTVYAPLVPISDNVTKAEVEAADAARVCRPKTGELETAYGCVAPSIRLPYLLLYLYLYTYSIYIYTYTYTYCYTY